jgi:hypothetical protein
MLKGATGQYESKQSFVDWWEGRSTIDGHERSPAKRAEPSWLQKSSSQSLLRFKRPDLMAYNDGSSLEIEKLMPADAQRGDPRLRQAGILPFDSHEKGVLDQLAGWRQGDDEGFTMDGSPDIRARPKDPKIDGTWREGDDYAFTFGMERSMHPKPQEREGGVGRRAHPAIMAHNDGSLLSMLPAFRDQEDRERHNAESYLLRRGASLEVAGVPRGEHVSALNPNRGTMLQDTLKDPSPFTLSGTMAKPVEAHVRRQRTDVTSEGTLTAQEFAAGEAARLEATKRNVNLSAWRQTEDMPISLTDASFNGSSPVRQHHQHLSSHQASWRFGDSQPYRIDGSVPFDPQKPNPNVNIQTQSVENAGRRYTDVVFHHQPALGIKYGRPHVATMVADGATSVTARQAPVNGDDNAGAWGPLASASPDVMNANLSWGEIGRRGMLKRSASEILPGFSSRAERQSASGSVVAGMSLIRQPSNWGGGAGELPGVSPQRSWR